jgi:GNAT superfamily N-acetyltransferase
MPIENELILRPAAPADTLGMLVVTRTIWEGHDYVPHEWEHWLEDPAGRVVVADLQDRVVGLARLARLAPGEWWLQGLRVDPEFQGRGIARRLHMYILAWWEAHCDGVLRLTTYQPPVKHLCQQTGFALVQESSIFIASSQADMPSGLRRLDPEDLPLPESGFFRRDRPESYSRYMDLGWEWIWPNPGTVAEAAREGKAWAMGEDGWLTWYDDEDEGRRIPLIRWLVCPPEKLGDCLTAFRRLGGELGYSEVGWVAPLEEPVLEILASTGYRRAWENFVCLYEKRHPAGGSGNQG